ncbi:MAG: alanine racemase [Bacteroidales bacterium]
MLHTSYIELSKKALNNNINYLKNKLSPDTRYSMVIKGNAYGHGIESILPMIEETGITHFSVFSVDEAMRAHKIKKDICDIMIMGFVDNEYLEWTIEHDMSFFVFTRERLDAVTKVAKKTSKKARVHIELETGMHRTGFMPHELTEVAEILTKNDKTITLEGLCTHFAGAESISNFDRINKQIKRFRKTCNWFYDFGLKPRYRHVACSAGLLNFPDYTMDLVRIGISNYGFWPSEETRMLHMKGNGNLPHDPLQRVLSWKSKILSVNHVGEGEYVSYGQSYITNRDSLIAVVPVGYSFGFSRTLSNMGHVLVRGKRVTVIGTVNMNMIVIDVTDVPDVKVNDEVVLIGDQGNLSISVSSFSNMNNSMNYELLTRLPEKIPRYQVE